MAILKVDPGIISVSRRSPEKNTRAKMIFDDIVAFIQSGDAVAEIKIEGVRNSKIARASCANVCRSFDCVTVHKEGDKLYLIRTDMEV